MSTTIPGGRVQLHLQQSAEEVFEPEFLRDVPLIRFAAYRANDRLFGWVRLRESRLTDLLNACDSISLENVEVSDFARGSVRAIEHAVVRREELVAIHASGPRGDAIQRRPTNTAPVAVWAGNYLIAGRLHLAPGDEPVESFHRRAPMVPLTEAWIEYWSGEERPHRSTGTIIVNRNLVELVRPFGSPPRR